MSAGLTLRAHAKINLNLSVRGRRPDGFHDIESIVQSISLHDTLTLAPAADGIEIRVEGADLPLDRRNLVRRAADLLLESGADRRGARIVLRKSIPPGSGLGGGSSDAAAALIGLNRLWKLGRPTEAIAALSPRLGSDVPYFFTGGTALISGRGERVQELPDLTPWPLLIVLPERPLDTATIYAQVDVPLTPAGKTGSMNRFGPSPPRGLAEWVRAGNDLERHAVRQCPDIGTIREQLRSAGAFAVAMTGSGSAVFGAFRDSGLRDRADVVLRRAGWNTVPCAPVSRLDYRKTLGLY